MDKHLRSTLLNGKHPLASNPTAPARLVLQTESKQEFCKYLSQA
ncbi:hypothetical protein PI172_0020 [Prevotella intermedia]|uniref:Uncharacterized protein n=1 Tax=Prevotella intermedia TaxID=28131 RepID=A0AAD1BFW4_PREIN|nr:hypothetical protein PIN17_A0744 [Prevotella intermedia 17]BAR94748.1 hypothetical protein PI172_0020 [Prevotella intermedia]